MLKQAWTLLSLLVRFNGNTMITTSGGGALICNANRCKSNDNDTLCYDNDNSRLDGDIVAEGESSSYVSAEESTRDIMWYTTQERDAYPYYQHTAIGYNYRMSNVCAGIGRGQMTVLDAHIAHHKHVQALYRELLKDVPGIHIHEAPVHDNDDDNDDGRAQAYACDLLLRFARVKSWGKGEGC